MFWDLDTFALSVLHCNCIADCTTSRSGISPSDLKKFTTSFCMFTAIILRYRALQGGDDDLIYLFFIIYNNNVNNILQLRIII